MQSVCSIGDCDGGVLVQWHGMGSLARTFFLCWAESRAGGAGIAHELSLLRPNIFASKTSQDDKLDGIRPWLLPI